jgi:archaellum component FlaC
MSFDQGTHDMAHAANWKSDKLIEEMTELETRINKKLDKLKKLNETQRKRIWRLEQRVTKLKGSI